MMTTISLFEEIEKITNECISQTSNKFSKLSEDQLKWKLNQETWSILEVFSHLNEYAAYYHPAFSKKIDITRYREPKINFISSPLGKSAWNAMKLGNAKNVKRKFQAAKSYNPTFVTSIVKNSAVSDFLQLQNEFLKIQDRAKTINIRKAKVGISISKIIRLRFGDALLFVTHHNGRHVQQAINVINHRSFPAK
jgi:hypothetical protein